MPALRIRAPLFLHWSPPSWRKPRILSSPQSQTMVGPIPQQPLMLPNLLLLTASPPGGLGWGRSPNHHPQTLLLRLCFSSGTRTDQCLGRCDLGQPHALPSPALPLSLSGPWCFHAHTLAPLAVTNIMIIATICQAHARYLTAII